MKKYCHSSLLIGPSHSGKIRHIKKIVSQILSIPIDDNALECHPDFFYIDGIEASMGSIRSVIEKLSYKSFYNAIKVLVFHNIDELNICCINALLKLIEEPKGKSIIWLTTKNIYKVPITIRSRCHKISMPILMKNAFFNNIQTDNLNSIEKEILYIISYANPVRGQYLLNKGILSLCFELYIAILSNDLSVIDKFDSIDLFKDLLEVCVFILYGKKFDFDFFPNKIFDIINKNAMYNLNKKTVMMDAILSIYI